MKRPSTITPVTRQSAVSINNQRAGIDRERREAQKQLFSEGCIIPTLADLEIEQKVAVRLNDKLGIKIGDCWRDQGRTRCYEVDTCKCPASCSRAFNYTKLDLLPDAIDLIENADGLPLFVTLVHPKWCYPQGDLVDFNVDKAKADLRRWLKGPGLDDLIGLAAFEFSLNVERDGSSCWQGHFHGVFAGASKPDLKSALAIDDRFDLLPNVKPLVVVEANDITRRLGYALKGGAEVRVAYLHANGRQHRSKDRLRAHERDEYQQWIANLQADQVLTFVGMRRYGGTLRPTGKNSPKSLK